MKTASLLLLFCLLTINIYSQAGYPEPLKTGKQFLVHSAGLPEEFLLFAPDTASQILFNPARANNFSGNFIYVNYLSDYTESYYYYPIYSNGVSQVAEPTGLKKSSGFNFPQIYQESYSTYKNPSFSAAALINSGSAKWLFELTNGINTYGTSALYTDNETAWDDPVNLYSTSHFRNTQEQHYDANLTSFKVSRIFKAGDLNLSTGIFGIIMTGNEDGEFRNSSENYYFRNPVAGDSSMHRSYRINDETDNINRNDARYVVGLEFTAGTGFFDYVGSIDYQFGDNSFDYSYDINASTYDSSRFSPGQSWQFNRSEEIRTFSGTSSQKPSVLNLSNYFRHKLGLLDPGDNVFISVNAFYSAGSYSFRKNYEEIYRAYYPEVTSGDTTEFANSDSYDYNDWGFSVSAGYVYERKVDDLSLLTGLKFSGNVEHLDGVNNSSVTSINGGFEKIVFKPSGFSITLPVYVDYSPADWASVFGGLNYTYDYLFTKTHREMNLTYQNYSTEITERTTQNRTDHSWRSYKSIYFGCALKHSSGLRAQFLFDGDIAKVSDWNVSLGYEF